MYLHVCIKLYTFTSVAPTVYSNLPTYMPIFHNLYCLHVYADPIRYCLYEIHM